ncbi:hypothetical protein EXIGLDRAFT_845888 [Exidia glandulosa HHB12029]|uniref:F-box domain-containing protein n=1 Tax=Exidia glandulosa HHB12029 TaxID=1314781 RepID=A0A165B8R5_EXIGL|nr:hypothetical protein EXIGLDRAFT_845888 [Exidia glandulosa HHB12029]
MDHNVEVSAARTNALESAVIAVCSEVVSTLAGELKTKDNALIGLIRSSLFGIVNAAFDDFLHRLSQAQPVSTLPAELLCRVFEFLDLADRVTATHVCRQWRSTSLAAPAALWCDVVFRGGPAGVLSDMLERTRDLPVSLDATVMPDSIDQLSECLMAHMHHIRHLNIDVQFMPSSQQDIDLSTALNIEAPILERFLFFNPDSQFIYRPSELGGIFGGHAPGLGTVKLQGDISHFDPASALASARAVTFAESDWTLRDDLNALFAVFPLVESLCIEVDECSSMGLPDLVLNFPNLLTHLAVTLNTEVDAVDPCDVLALVDQHTNNVHDVYLCINTHLEAEHALRLLQACISGCGNTVTYLAVMSSVEDTDVIVQMQGTNGQRRTVTNIPCEVMEEWPTGTFDNLTKLSISEASWMRGDLLPACPALVELEVRMLVPRYYPANSGDSIFVSSDSERQYLLSCPRLRTLALTTRRYNDPDMVAAAPLILAPDTVRDFIERRLAFESPTLRLERLVFRGTRLLQTPADQVARLLAIVDSIDFEDGKPSILADFDNVFRWD